MPGRYSYTVFTREGQYRTLYRIMCEQDLLWAAWPEVDEWTEDSFVARLMRPGVYVLGGEVDGMPAGAMVLWPFGEATLVAEVGLTAFRPYFKEAVPLCRGAFRHVMKTFNPAPAAFVGRVAGCHRHILRLLSRMGFEEIGRLPGLMWHGRKKAFVDGALVLGRLEKILGEA